MGNKTALLGFFLLLCAIASSSAQSFTGNGVQAYARKVESAHDHDIQREAKFANSVENQNKEVHNEEQLALNIEAEDAARNKKEELHKLAAQMSARKKAQKLGAEQLSEQNTNIVQTPQQKEAEKEAAKKANAIHWTKVGQTGAKAMRTIANEAYDEYNTDVNLAKKEDQARQDRFKRAKETEVAKDDEEHQARTEQFATGDGKTKQWQVALAAEEKRDAKEHEQFQRELARAKALLRSKSGPEMGRRGRENKVASSVVVEAEHDSLTAKVRAPVHVQHEEEEEEEKGEGTSRSKGSVSKAEEEQEETKKKEEGENPTTLATGHTTPSNPTGPTPVSTAIPARSAQIGAKPTPGPTSAAAGPAGAKAKVGPGGVKEGGLDKGEETRAKLKAAAVALEEARQKFLQAARHKEQAEAKLHAAPAKKLSGWQSILYSQPKNTRRKELQAQLQQASHQVALTEQRLALAVRNKYHLEREMELQSTYAGIYQDAGDTL